MFYTLDARRSEKPRIARAEECLHCHQGPATLGVPGVYVGSVATSPSGRADFRLGSTVTDHRTPFAERWGGSLTLNSSPAEGTTATLLLPAAPGGARP